MPSDVREKPSGAEATGSPPAVRKSTARNLEAAAVYEGLDYLIDQFRTRQDEIARAAGAPNHDVYEQRLAVGAPGFTAVPHCMFFYYVRIDRDGRLRVVHYRYVDGDPEDPNTWQPIPYSGVGLKQLVEKLARNARPSGLKDPRPDPEGELSGHRLDAQELRRDLRR